MNSTLIRAISGAVYVLLLLFVISFSVESFIILFGIFLIIAISEFSKLVNLNAIISIVIGVIFYVTSTLIVGTRLSNILLLTTTLLVSIKAIVFLFDGNNKPIDVQSKYIYLIGYLIFPFIIITKIPFVESTYNSKIIISIFTLIWTNDTFAFIVGKSIGKTKLFEKISPKKTIEGFIGGVVFVILAGILLAKFYLNQSLFQWVLTAIIVGVFGTIGDLVESKFKRVANVKDSGNIMPGHGGILDRLDSIIFVAPIVYLFYQILGYVS
jgi:phosphatidate cytidylyltransferase